MENLYIIIFSVFLYFVYQLIYSKKFASRQDMIRKLIRQSARFSVASRSDRTSLISVLHSNYGATYMFALKDLFSDKEIEDVIGSEELRKKFESKIIEIQDNATKNVVKHCPQYTDEIGFLTKLAGQI